MAVLQCNYFAVFYSHSFFYHSEWEVTLCILPVLFKKVGNLTVAVAVAVWLL
jgi:hypothetical protein